MTSTLVERPRLFTKVPRIREDGLLQPRVLLFLGMVGSGKTVASRLYLQQLPWPSVVVELNSRVGYGWPTIQDALVKLGLPSARPALAIERISEPVVVVIDQLESALTKIAYPARMRASGWPCCWPTL